MMAKTDWQMGDTVLPDDLNQIGQEINQNRDNLAAHTAATTGVHGATSTATPNTIIQRDSAGRAKVAAPAAADDIARKDTVDAVQTNLTNHTAATTGVHGATSAATPNTIVQRDAQGRIKAAAPAAADDVARKAEVDAHASRTDNPHGVTKAQVGLGNVPNYPAASQAQAEAGADNATLMTPLRTKQYVDTRLQNGLTLRDHNGTVERWNQQKGGWEPVAAVFPVGQPRSATLSLTDEQNNAYYTVLDISGVSGRLEFVQAQVSNNGPGHVFYMRVTVDGKSDEFSAQSNTTANMSLNYLVRPYGGANNLVGDVSDPIYFQNSVKVEIKKTGARLSATIRYRLAAGTP